VLLTSGFCRPHVVLITESQPHRLANFLKTSSLLNFTHESLGYPDGSQHHDFDVNTQLLERLTNIIAQPHWTGIYTHGPTGEYGHPQHIQCCQVVSKIVFQVEEEEEEKEEEDSVHQDSTRTTHDRPLLYYFSPYIDSTLSSDAHMMVSMLYPSEDLMWSQSWHARVVPWYLYDTVGAREICTHHGFELWRDNCRLLGLPSKNTTTGRRRKRHTIGIMHFRDLTTPLSSFEVGFMAAMNMLRDVHGYELLLLNIHDLQGVLPGSDRYNKEMRKYDKVDLLFVKSNWEWIPDQFVRSVHLAHITKPKVLLISGVAPLPEDAQVVQFYDGLVYETLWYYHWQRLSSHHANVHQAFGIDTTIMRRRQEEMATVKTWDLLFVGWMAPWKRLELFVARFQLLCAVAKSQGKKRPAAIAIGKLDATEDSMSIIQMLQNNGIIVRTEVPYSELARLIQDSKEMYIPSTVQGGGERAVLEAKACGVVVRVEEDNPKLKELAALVDVPGPMKYADGLHRALQSILL